MVVETEAREPSDNKQQTGLKSLKTQAPSGGLLILTKRWSLYVAPSAQIPGSGTTYTGAPTLIRQTNNKLVDLPEKIKLTHRFVRTWLVTGRKVPCDRKY
jgi:hypothetical protein